MAYMAYVLDPPAIWPGASRALPPGTTTVAPDARGEVDALWPSMAPG